MHFKKTFTVAILIIFCTLAVQPVLAQEGGTQNAISQAENTLNNVYGATRQAEASGADVTPLVAALNEAAALLSKAQLSLNSQDYDAAYNYAVQSQNTLNGLESEAVSLKSSAAERISGNFLTLILSLGASLGLLSAGIAFWIVLGRRQRRTNNAAATV